jgi:hypothetical protein
MSLGTAISDEKFWKLNGVEVKVKAFEETFYIPYAVKAKWIVITTPDGFSYRVDADAIWNDGIDEDVYYEASEERMKEVEKE